MHGAIQGVHPRTGARMRLIKAVSPDQLMNSIDEISKMYQSKLSTMLLTC